VAFYRTFDPNAKGITRVYLPPVPKCGGLYSLQSGGLFQKAGTKVADMDCAKSPSTACTAKTDDAGLVRAMRIPFPSVG
jgi:hypothetical protein